MDIIIYGGSAGGGKTYALFLESLRHHANRLMRVTFFRRNAKDIVNAGGLWDESGKIYPFFNAVQKQQAKKWVFPSGCEVSFKNIQYESDKYNFGGSQMPVMLFDELTEFSEGMFWYLYSRNRSDSGVDGYVRATCNPDPDSWVKKFISWWLTPEGYADQNKSGVIRWFCRDGDEIIWASSRKELAMMSNIPESECKSFTFVSANVDDNQILIQNNPQYISKLKALPSVERERLLRGNWNIRHTGKIFFQKDFKTFINNPYSIQWKIITIDTAQKTKDRNDYTVMQAWVLSEKGIYLVDQFRAKVDYSNLKISFLSFISKHRNNNGIYIEDSASGVSLIQELKNSPIKLLVYPITRIQDKYTRAYKANQWIVDGYVFLNPTMEYYNDLINEAVNFDVEGKHKHDDQIDCMMDAIEQLLANPPLALSNKNNERRMLNSVSL